MHCWKKWRYECVTLHITQRVWKKFTHKQSTQAHTYTHKQDQNKNRKIGSVELRKLIAEQMNWSTGKKS